MNNNSNLETFQGYWTSRLQSMTTGDPYEVLHEAINLCNQYKIYLLLSE